MVGKMILRLDCKEPSSGLPGRQTENGRCGHLRVNKRLAGGHQEKDILVHTYCRRGQVRFGRARGREPFSSDVFLELKTKFGRVTF